MRRKACPRLVIAGTRGGSGKTTVSLGVISALRSKGLSVVPYKKGPDYIDAGWLSSAAGRACYNLDPYLIGRERILSSFAGHFGDSDCAVIEGNRGLYDGMDAQGTYSTAELAKMLRAPVVLVVDCTKATRTIGAIVLGMRRFDRKVALKGVILNQIAGARHEKVVRETIERYCGLPVVGAIPRLGGDFLAERHMGLTPFQEDPEVAKKIALAEEIAVRHIDLDTLLKIARGAVSMPVDEGDAGEQSAGVEETPVIGVIRDSAFQFYYPENFEELKRKGAAILEISALSERRLPDVDALYIGGGFPETHAIALAENAAFRRALRAAIDAGLPVYAECGGFMYLGESLRLEGRTYPMAGVFPVVFSLEKKPQAHGYTVVEVREDNPFYPRNTLLKGHEFHYSRVLEIDRTDRLTFAFSMKRGVGITDELDGVCYNNALATYTHLHAYGAPEWADGLVRRALLYRAVKSEVTDQKKNHKCPGKP